MNVYLRDNRFGFPKKVTKWWGDRLQQPKVLRMIGNRQIGSRQIGSIPDKTGEESTPTFFEIQF